MMSDTEKRPDAKTLLTSDHSMLFFQYLLNDNSDIDISSLNYDHRTIPAFISGMCFSNKNLAIVGFLSLMTFFQKE